MSGGRKWPLFMFLLISVTQAGHKSHLSHKKMTQEPGQPCIIHGSSAWWQSVKQEKSNVAEYRFYSFSPTTIIRKDPRISTGLFITPPNHSELFMLFKKKSH